MTGRWRWVLVGLGLLAGVAACTAEPPTGSAATLTGTPAEAEHRTRRVDNATPRQQRRPVPRPEPRRPTKKPVALGPQEPLSPTRPPWLGKRVLPVDEHGFGQMRPTPPALRNRRLPTSDTLPVPGPRRVKATITKVPRAVVARSTWSPTCPVALDDLRYVRVPFVGFDGRRHAGELIVHHSAAQTVADVFLDLYDAAFPIEEMRVVRADELNAPPTGDGNNTTAFVCRPTRGATSWSQHAYGLAVDINPFHNPYVRGDVVLPELASAYRDRDWRRPGMVTPGSPPVEAFTEIAWVWGGTWGTLKDWMHFSANGR